ncbi:hypothetical protein BH92_27895 (plasmid) [Rhodococcoides fascians A21d2]|uniref:hypothetical protein n=1 Tax=Rhodococcoides fascians TaxID=1828 RepID=UPI0012D2CD35|nr:hypothetical protein [Rhodococcus fascians]QII03878.1 hypothetical protein BH92_27895 [Rhodococcus fascians A21d2]
MNQNACIVAATVIPVLLVAGLLQANQLHRARSFLPMKIWQFVMICGSVAGIIAAWQGVLNVGLDRGPWTLAVSLGFGIAVAGILVEAFTALFAKAQGDAQRG